MRKKFSIIVPVYKNELNLPVTIPYIIEHLNLFPEYDVEVIMVCDGSPDNSYAVMQEYQKKYPDYLKTVNFTRNFGQGAAIHCGMEISTGDVIGVISCDLQDPFELFVELLKEWENGSKIVIASRQKRKDRGISALGSKIFHKLIHKYINSRYPSGGFDFFVIDREVANAFCEADAPNGSLQMLLLWLGYEYKEIKYTRAERTIGKSSWNIGRKVDAALGLVTTYSPCLLRFLGVLGTLLTGIGSLGTIIFAIAWLFGSIVPAVLFVIFVEGLFTGVVLIALWLVGEYLWRAFELVKNRPRYVIEKVNDCIKEDRL